MLDYTKCPDYITEDDEFWAEDGCQYPYYGLAPHDHDLNRTGSVIGSTIIKNKKEWPGNFKEDKECEGLGIYYCPYNEECKD